jgi:putative N6-adenine-specific DNA methylase
VLHDPMCGSGTILAEAALMATQTPAAFLREKW